MKLEKLKGKIAESNLSKKVIAQKMGITQQALGKKLNGKTKITTVDATRLCDILEISDDNEKVNIFLT